MIVKNLHKSIWVFLILVFLLAGCLARHKSAEIPVQWDLSPEAGLTYHYLRARDAVHAGKPYEAGVLLENYLKDNPNPDISMEAASLFWQAEYDERALELMSRAVQAFPDDPRLRIHLAELYIALQDNARARSVLKNLVENFTDNLQVLENAAALYSEMGDHPQVLDVLKQVDSQDRNAAMLFYMGRAVNETGDRTRAVKLLNQAVQMQPDFFQAWAELAYIHELERDYIKAEEIYEKLLNSGRVNQDIITRLIELNLKLNNPEKARYFVDNGPDDVQFRLDAANQFIKNSFYQHAYDILEDIRASGSYPPRIYFYMALIAYEGWSDPDRALGYLAGIPEQDFYHMQALSFMIQIYFEEDQYKKALELAGKGRELYSSETRFPLFEAIILEKQGEYSQALDVLDSALKENPEDTELMYRKGVVLDQNDMDEQAMQVMEDIIATDQDHHQALNYVGYTLAEDNKDLDRALVLISRALEFAPSSPHYLDSLAWVYFRMGKLHQAWEEIRKAVAHLDDDPIIWEHYGDIARALGLREEALKGYQKSLESGPENPDLVQGKISELQKDIQNGQENQEN